MIVSDIYLFVDSTKTQAISDNKRVHIIIFRQVIVRFFKLLYLLRIIGWILPYFIYRKVAKKQTEKLQPLIEEKLEEIYQVCEKGHSLL